MQIHVRHGGQATTTSRFLVDKTRRTPSPHPYTCLSCVILCLVVVYTTSPFLVDRNRPPPSHMAVSVTGLGPKYSVLQYFGTRVPILQYSSVLSTRPLKSTCTRSCTQVGLL